MNGDDAYVLAKKYTDKTLNGLGSLKGEDGFSPTIVENSHNSEDIYKLDITDVNGTKTTPNLKADISEVKNELQEEINKKANVIHTHVSADITDVDTAPTNGSEELVTSGGVYTALSGKQSTITGGASTITSSNLTASRALVSDASGKVAVSDVTSTELGYLDGVTSNVQTQLNNKAPESHASTATTYGIGTSSNYGHVKLSDSTTSTSSTSSGVAATPAAVKEAYDKANIKKNPNSTTGDIITTHLTVGTRASGSTYGNQTFSVGANNTVSESFSFAIGYLNTISSINSAAIGQGNTTSGFYSIAIGNGNTASGQSSFATGNSNTASGFFSFASGYRNTALNYQAKFGRYASDGTAGSSSGTTGDVLIVGIGDSSSRKNGFRVDFAGNGYFYKAVSGTGADYAEMWEWQDGNPNGEDRVGYFVAFDGDKIRFANENDDLRKVGIISGNPAVIGDNFADDWQGMYLQDIYGRNITEHKSYDAEYDEDGNLIHEAYEADEYVLNSDYNPNEEYIPRRQRKEWDAVGTHGKLVVRDDGTCQVDGFCKPANGGIATASDTGFYVMERVNENHIRVYIR